LQALNQTDGRLVWERILNSHNYSIITQSGTRLCNVLFVGVSSLEEGALLEGNPCCSFIGGFYAVRWSTGEILWQFNTTQLPRPGAAVWGSSPVIDLDLQSVYFTTGDIYNGLAIDKTCLQQTGNFSQCVPDTVLGNSIISVNIVTGQKNWAYRSWEGDYFNYACFINPEACAASFPQSLDYDF